MPSLVMLPFIQCHQTRGRAPLGGFSKPLLRGRLSFAPGQGTGKEPRTMDAKANLAAECFMDFTSGIDDRQRWLGGAALSAEHRGAKVRG